MSKESTELNLDLVLQELGSFGRYNILTFTLLLIPIYLSGLYGNQYVFTAADLDYRCEVPQCEYQDAASDAWLNFTIPKSNSIFEKCKRYSSTLIDTGINDTSQCVAESFMTNVTEACDKIVYLEHHSLVKTFDLACQDWKRTLVGTIHSSGQFVSMILTGFLSDRYGRKPALAIASVLNGVFGLCRSFSTSYEMYLVFEFLEPAIGAGAYTSAFVIAMELVGPKGRVLGNTIINVFFVLGAVSLAGLAKWLQNWQYLLRLMYAPALLLISYMWILNESIRWLLSKGRKDEAIAILKRAAKVNGVKFSDAVLTSMGTPMISRNENEEKELLPEAKVISVEVKSTFKQLLKSAIMRRRLVTCSFLWITCSFVYYGLAINSVSLPGNKYTNFMFVSLVEIPANIIVFLVLDKYGRKRVLILTFLISGITCIGLTYVPQGSVWWSLLVYLLGKTSITVAYSSVYIYVSEVFPTSLRQSLLGLCSTIGRIGSIIAPQTPLLALYYKSLPSLLFGSMSLIASVLVLTLPETINVALPDTIEEAENLSRRKKVPGDA